MGRGAQAFWTALAAAGGLGVGLVAGRLATKGQSSAVQANVTLATSAALAATAAGVTSYVTTPKLQLTA